MTVMTYKQATLMYMYRDTHRDRQTDIHCQIDRYERIRKNETGREKVPTCKFGANFGDELLSEN